MASLSPLKKPRRSLKWDEEAIAEHDKLRGTRQKIDEPDTPFEREMLPVDQDELETSADSLMDAVPMMEDICIRTATSPNGGSPAPLAHHNSANSMGGGGANDAGAMDAMDMDRGGSSSAGGSAGDMSLASNWAELEGKLGAAAARQDEGEDLRPLEEDEEEKERKRREFKARRAAHYGGMGHGVSGEGGGRPMSEGERMKMMRAKMMEEDEEDE